MDFTSFYREERGSFKKGISSLVKGRLPSFHEGVRYPLREMERGTFVFHRAICSLYGVKTSEVGQGLDLLHSAFHVHDDIMDGDRTRDSKNTVWMKYGLPHAINIGDAQIAFGFRALGNAKIAGKEKGELLNLFSKMLLEVSEGQAMDVNMKYEERASPKAYLDMIQRKSGCIGQVAAECACVLAGAPKKEREAIGDYGRNASVLSRLRADNELRMDDLREGKITLPIIEAMDSLSEEERKILRRILNKPREETTDKEVEVSRELIVRSGGLKRAKKLEEAYQKEAIKSIVALSKQKKEYLVALLESGDDRLITR